MGTIKQNLQVGNLTVFGRTDPIWGRDWSKRWELHLPFIGSDTDNPPTPLIENLSTNGAGAFVNNSNGGRYRLSMNSTAPAATAGAMLSTSGNTILFSDPGLWFETRIRTTVGYGAFTRMAVGIGITLSNAEDAYSIMSRYAILTANQSNALNIDFDDGNGNSNQITTGRGFTVDEWITARIEARNGRIYFFIDGDRVGGELTFQPATPRFFPLLNVQRDLSSAVANLEIDYVSFGGLRD